MKKLRTLLFEYSLGFHSFCFLIKKLFKNWSIIDLQCCVSFRCTASFHSYWMRLKRVSEVSRKTCEVLIVLLFYFSRDPSSLNFHTFSLSCSCLTDPLSVSFHAPDLTVGVSFHFYGEFILYHVTYHHI